MWPGRSPLSPVLSVTAHWYYTHATCLAFLRLFSYCTSFLLSSYSIKQWHGGFEVVPNKSAASLKGHHHLVSEGNFHTEVTGVMDKCQTKVAWKKGTWCLWVSTVFPLFIFSWVNMQCYSWYARYKTWSMECWNHLNKWEQLFSKAFFYSSPSWCLDIQQWAN